MQVNFKRQYFGPDGSRYRKGINEVPEEMRNRLPKGAVIIEAPAPTPADTETKTKAEKKSGLFSEKEKAAAEA